MRRAESRGRPRRGRDQLSAEHSGAGTLMRRYAHGTGDDDPLIWYEGATLTARRSLQANRHCY